MSDEKEIRELVLEAQRHFDANNGCGKYDSGDKRNGFARFAASFYVTKQAWPRESVRCK